MKARTPEEWRKLRRDAISRLTSLVVELPDGYQQGLSESDPRFDEFNDAMVELLASSNEGYALSRLETDLRSYLSRKYRCPLVTDQQILEAERKYPTRNEQAKALGIGVRAIQKRKKAMTQ